MTDYTIERIYPIDWWYRDRSEAVLAALHRFRADVAAEAAQTGHAIEDAASITAYLQGIGGRPATGTDVPTEVRFVATWR